MVEVLTSAVFVALLITTGWTVILAKYLILGALLMAISFIDLEHYIIPDVLNLCIAIGGTASLLFVHDITIVQGIIGATVVGGLLLILGLAVPGGMGGGDIKLGAALGFALGWPLAPLGLLLGSMAGGIVSLVLIVAGVKGRKDAIPFGPFVAVGALMAMTFGERIIEWYAVSYL